jgi:hypothetical protein
MSTTDTPIDKLEEVIRELFGSQKAQEEMKSDPEGFFAGKGLADITPEQVDRCVADMAPTYATSGHMAQVSSASAGAAAASPAAAAASHVVAHHETIVQQYGDFTYIDQSSESYVDNSVEVGDVFAVGSDVDLDIDNQNTTATEGGVAVGEDGEISGNVNTGTVNGVQGDGNTVDDITFGDGNTSVEDNSVTQVQAGGDAVLGDGNTTTDINVVGSEDTNIAMGDGNQQVANDIDNSVDNSVDNSINDSFDVEDSFNTDNSINDSFDTEDSFNSTDNSVDVQTDVSTDVGLL